MAHVEEVPELMLAGKPEPVEVSGCSLQCI